MNALEKVSVIPNEPAGPASPLPVIQSEATAMLHMIERAARDPAFDVSKMLALMDERRRVINEQKRAAFDEAMASAKAEIPVINKNRVVDFTSQKGRTHYKYEDLAEIARIVSPILAKFGLSYRYRVTSNINEPVTVTCIVSHRAGHFEEVTLLGGRDDSGNKNSIQAVASTLTYLQRMTLKAALGLAASDDDDGQSSDRAEQEAYTPPADSISQEQADQIRDLLEARGVKPIAFLQWAGLKRVEDVPADKFEKCIAKIQTVGKAPQ